MTRDIYLQRWKLPSCPSAGFQELLWREAAAAAHRPLSLVGPCSSRSLPGSQHGTCLFYSLIRSSMLIAFHHFTNILLKQEENITGWNVIQSQKRKLWQAVILLSECTLTLHTQHFHTHGVKALCTTVLHTAPFWLKANAYLCVFFRHI